MLSYRIKVQFENQTGKVIASSGSGLGGMAVRAPRGTTKPTYFKAGQTMRLFELCGDPGPDYPDLMEAAYYLSFYPLWVAAPSKNGRFGGVLMTTTGSVPLPGGVSAIPAISPIPTTLTVFYKLGVGDGTTTSFGATLPSFGGTHYSNLSIRIFKNGVAVVGQTVTLDGVITTQEDIATSPNIGSGTYARNTHAVSFTFSSAPAVGDIIEAQYDFALTNVLAVFFSRAPQLDYLRVEITQNTDTATTYQIDVQGDNGFGTFLAKENLNFSLVSGATNANGKVIDARVLFGAGADDYLQAVVISTTNQSATDDSAYVLLAGGSRGQAIAGSDLASAVAQFSAARTYPVDIFMDNSGLPEVGTAFSTLRGGEQQFSQFLLAMPNVDETTTLGAPTAISDRGVRYFWNWGRVSNPYNDKGTTWTSLIGEIGKNHADILVKAFGGIAASWTNENGMGGQLISGRVLELAFDPDQANLKLLDAAGINAITLDPSYGAMIMSERTSDKTLSDYSYTSYSNVIDYIVKNIVNQVLPAQLEKFNDDAHRTQVANKCVAIMRPMTIRPVNVLFAFAVKCDAENNNADVLNAESFVLQVAVQVTRKARTIVFTFINSPAGIDIQQAFA